MSYTVGVDLGSTVCAAAIKRDGHLEPCSLGDVTLTIPSIVLPRDDGRTLIGGAAALHGGIAPLHVAEAGTQSGNAALGAVVTPAPPPHENAAEMASLLLDAVVEQVTNGRGTRPDGVVVAQPGCDPGGLRRLAAESLGYETSQVPAPVAAATTVARDYHMGAGTTLAILDLGGDLCEATLVCRTDEGMSVLGEPVVTPGIGGADVDRMVCRHIDAALGHMVSELDPENDADATALQRLSTACRDANRRLLHEDEAVVEVGLPRLTARVRLTRRDVQKLIRPRLAASVAALERLIDSAALIPADLHAVVLVGGPARLGGVTELVSERLACPTIVDALPEMTTALGAALLGSPDEDALPTDLPTLGDLSEGASGGADAGSVAAAVTASPVPDDDAVAPDGADGRRRLPHLDPKLLLVSAVLVMLMLVGGVLAVSSVSSNRQVEPTDSIGTASDDGPTVPAPGGAATEPDDTDDTAPDPTTSTTAPPPTAEERPAAPPPADGGPDQPASDATVTGQDDTATDDDASAPAGPATPPADGPAPEANRPPSPPMAPGPPLGRPPVPSPPLQHPGRPDAPPVAPPGPPPDLLSSLLDWLLP